MGQPRPWWPMSKGQLAITPRPNSTPSSDFQVKRVGSSCSSATHRPSDPEHSASSSLRERVLGGREGEAADEGDRPCPSQALSH